MKIRRVRNLSKTIFNILRIIRSYIEYAIERKKLGRVRVDPNCIFYKIVEKDKDICSIFFITRINSSLIT